jgi:hypothetical protein
MKIKNKDGTINSLPICIIFSIFAVAIHILVFGVDIKEVSKPLGGEIITTKNTTKANTTINMCNDCSMRFKYDTADVSTNGEFDISEILIVERIFLSSIKFDSSDKNIFTLSPSGSSIKIVTGNLEGSAVLSAQYGDKETKIVINVVHPSKASIKYKEDYYFVSLKNRITPELETYPFGYNLNGIAFTVDGKDIISVNKTSGEVSGRKVGTDIVRAKVGGLTASTKIIVVENLITVKINDAGTYKKAREITPSGNSFDFVIQFEDKNRANYDNKNLSITFDRNDLNADVSFVKKHSEANSYIYHMELSGSGTTTMRIDLPDGSFTLFDVHK